jgi:hypothetical protein
MVRLLFVLIDVVTSSWVNGVLKAKSNQKNLGTIKSSNLCTEIIEYSSPDDTAVCHPASIALPTFITNGVYDFKKLHSVAKVVAYNLNKIIDVNYYPTPEARCSNFSSFSAIIRSLNIISLVPFLTSPPSPHPPCVGIYLHDMCWREEGQGLCR